MGSYSLLVNRFKGMNSILYRTPRHPDELGRPPIQITINKSAWGGLTPD